MVVGRVVDVVTVVAVVVGVEPGSTVEVEVEPVIEVEEAEGSVSSPEVPVAPTEVVVGGVVDEPVVDVVEVGRVVLVRTPDCWASSVTKRPV